MDAKYHKCFMWNLSNSPSPPFFVSLAQTLGAMSPLATWLPGNEQRLSSFVAACQVFQTAVNNGSWDAIWKHTTRFIVDTFHYITHCVLIFFAEYIAILHLVMVQLQIWSSLNMMRMDVHMLDEHSIPKYVNN